MKLERPILNKLYPNVLYAAHIVKTLFNVMWSDQISLKQVTYYAYNIFIWGIASLRINISLKTVQLSPPIIGTFCEYIIFLFCP